MLRAAAGYCGEGVATIFCEFAKIQEDSQLELLVGYSVLR
jgi:hypothetical protein